MPTPEEQAELEALERKLEASRRLGDGYKDRIAAIEARLEELRNDD